MELATIYNKKVTMILIDMINIIFLFLAEVLEFVAVLLSLPSKLIADISSFFYGASRAFDNNSPDDNSDE